MAPRYSLLIFDWDGTLVDSVGAIVASMQAAITAAQLPPRSDAEIATLIGLGPVEGLRILYPDIPISDIQARLAEYRRQHAQSPQIYGRFFLGVEQAVRSLHAQGYKIAVATGKSRAGLDRALADGGLETLLCASRTVDECASKPEPDMIEELLWETDTAPEQALMIGDTEYDLAMAVHAGVHSVGVRSGAHSEAELRRHKPQAVLDSVADLPSWLEVS